jgi:two-component system, chemotaxis family, protein-glutamate methylesterase/glutaminase
MSAGLEALLKGRHLEAVAIGASAGGIDALFRLTTNLPAAFALPIVAVVHLPDGHVSRLPEIFSARLALRVEEARPGAALLAGTMYFAPPGYHLLVEPQRSFSLSCEPPVRFSRPAIDPLFESCAEAYGEALMAMVLTGASDDGARGLQRVRDYGGLAVVQDPAEAAHPTMPEAAIAQAHPQAVLGLAELHALLLRCGAS